MYGVTLWSQVITYLAVACFFYFIDGNFGKMYKMSCHCFCNYLWHFL